MHSDHTASIAYLALGSNLEYPDLQVKTAIKEIGELRSTQLLATSSLYQTPPWGVTTQSPFINAVVKIETAISPLELLKKMQALEQKHHRIHYYPNGPRTLDLDLLLYEDLVFSDPMLTLPHPRMYERAFVLVPLFEIAPSLLFPDKTTLQDRVKQVDETGILRLEDRILTQIL